MGAAFGKVLVIGLGGIGGFVAEPLARWLAFSGVADSLTLVDGDRYEEGNKDRQRVGSDGVGVNKAEAWATRLAPQFPQLRINSLSVYVTPNNIRDVIPNGAAIMLCVDNHATRKLVQEQCLKLRDVALVSAGNDYADGNAQVFLKKAGRTLSPAITLNHPEIENPRDRRPDEIGCDEEVESHPQLVFANMTAAALALNALYAVTQGELGYSEVYFDVIRNTARAVRRKS